MQRLEIKEYNLYDFMVKFQDAVLDGYGMSDTMQDAPQQFGTIFYAGLVKGESGVAPSDTEAVGKRGRKPKE